MRFFGTCVSISGPSLPKLFTRLLDFKKSKSAMPNRCIIHLIFSDRLVISPFQYLQQPPTFTVGTVLRCLRRQTKLTVLEKVNTARQRLSPLLAAFLTQLQHVSTIFKIQRNRTQLSSVGGRHTSIRN
jgi:hypothetical protein